MMPEDGADCPAMVTKGFRILRSDRKFTVPLISNKQILGPLPSTHFLRLPFPESLRLETKTTLERGRLRCRPDPPSDEAPNPTADGVARELQFGAASRLLEKIRAIANNIEMTILGSWAISTAR